ncbi:unnamed protein product [Nezara viridula]|uniref:Uncharacterized protein n=1 Tax=Nezara viridula TaxID=85310 RepID=A0A9P0EAS2_NEZVI|nr:unnamed protein product [Nezara viridula]
MRLETIAFGPVYEIVLWSCPIDIPGEGYLARGAIKPLAVSRYEWQCVNGSDRCRRLGPSTQAYVHQLISLSTIPRWLYPSKTARSGNKYK